MNPLFPTPAPAVRLFRVAGDVHACSLDASTGRVPWNVAFGDPTRGESAPMAPLAWCRITTSAALSRLAARGA